MYILGSTQAGGWTEGTTLSSWKLSPSPTGGAGVQGESLLGSCSSPSSGSSPVSSPASHSPTPYIASQREC